MRVVYHDNKNLDWMSPAHPGSTVLTTEADTISEADVVFRKQTGLDPDKSPWIGRELIFNWKKVTA